jgi:hypothetical protein
MRAVSRSWEADFEGPRSARGSHVMAGGDGGDVPNVDVHSQKTDEFVYPTMADGIY